MAQCLPVIFVAITAIVRGQPQIAIGVIFGSCVATLSLVLGVVTFTAPPDQIGVDARRRWGFVLPAAVLIVLAGFQSQFTFLHALVLGAEGVVVLMMWMSPKHERQVASEIEMQDAGGLIDAEPSIVLAQEGSEEIAKALPAWVAPIQILLAIVIALIAGWAGVSGSMHLLERSSLPSISIIAALLLGPALVIPMIGTDCSIAQTGDYTDAVNSQVAFVILNLCVILPLVIVAWYAQQGMPVEMTRDFWSRALSAQSDSPLAFPLIVWRVDAVMLLVLGLALLPMSLGRWLPGRAEGVLLIALYAVYMVLWRWASSIG